MKTGVPVVRPEDRTTYKVIMLKMKKTNKLPPEIQLKKAFTFLELGVKNTKDASKSVPKEKPKPSEKPEVIDKEGTEDKTLKLEEETSMKEEDTNYLECEEINYECIYCNENIMGKSNFVIHQKTAHNNEVFSCHKCELVYELKEDFEEHVKSHENEKIISSDVDDSTQSKSTEVLNENGKRRNDSSSESVAKKLKIDKLFPLSESSMNIIEDGSDDIYWKDETNNQFEPVQETKFQCVTCGKVYSSHLQLSQHSKTHVGRFKCPQCERTFNRQSNLANHIKKHKTESGFTCRICLETFTNRGDLLSHRRTHTRDELLGLKPLIVKEENMEETEDQNNSGNIKCPICHKAFQSRQKLDAHLIVHSDSSFPCHICGKVIMKAL
ncbi:hypothetical protein C0J52_17976 [Blattella germanica]|nr:hypothetical protein C0J52_17976 [Blattella germanica]